jgi:hypothetical protein
MIMNNTLSVTDNRTGAYASIPIEQGAVRALDLRPVCARGLHSAAVSWFPTHRVAGPEQG